MVRGVLGLGGAGFKKWEDGGDEGRLKD